MRLSRNSEPELDLIIFQEESLIIFHKDAGIKTAPPLEEWDKRLSNGAGLEPGTGSELTINPLDVPVLVLVPICFLTYPSPFLIHPTLPIHLPQGLSFMKLVVF